MIIDFRVRPPFGGFTSTAIYNPRPANPEPWAGQLAAYERNLATGQRTLQNLGMTAEQIDQVRNTREFAWLVEIRAPVSGFVLARNVSNGQRFEPSTELYTIADLSRVWILTDSFEGDAQHFKPGMRATVSQPGLGKTLAARVSPVLPQFDSATRTLKVRLEADNPGFVLARHLKWTAAR